MQRLVTLAKPWLWQLSVANLIANIAIILTGGAVRLTGSGLGCPTWPRCTNDSYVARGELGIHGVIEFGNRMLTFALVAVAVACWLAALGHRRQTGRRRAHRLSTVIALGVPAQAIIGGISVLTELNPWVVSLHLMVSLACGGWACALAQAMAARMAMKARVERIIQIGAWATQAASLVCRKNAVG